MTKSHLQLPKTAIFLFGCILFPTVITISLLVMDPLKYNFTGILNTPSLRIPAILFALLYGLFLFYLILSSSKTKSAYLYMLFWIAGVLTPYAKGSIAGQFHPELKSRPDSPAPLFVKLVEKAKDCKIM